MLRDASKHLTCFTEVEIRGNESIKQSGQLVTMVVQAILETLDYMCF